MRTTESLSLDVEDLLWPILRLNKIEEICGYFEFYKLESVEGAVYGYKVVPKSRTAILDEPIWDKRNARILQEEQFVGQSLDITDVLNVIALDAIKNHGSWKEEDNECFMTCVTFYTKSQKVIVEDLETM